ncbi:hypothetical protein COP2_035452 [Malus domestica]
MANFIAQLTPPDGSKSMVNSLTAFTSEAVASDVLPKQWSLFLDESSNRNGIGVGFLLITHDRKKFEYYPRLKFSAFNNKIEYKALLVELHSL